MGGKKHHPPHTVLFRTSLGYQALTCEGCKINTTEHRNKIITVSNMLIHKCFFHLEDFLFGKYRYACDISLKYNKSSICWPYLYFPAFNLDKIF